MAEDIRPPLDVDIMAKSEGTRAAYRVKCPYCKALPARFCIRLAPAYVGPYTPPDPTWGKPLKRPHNQRFHKAHEKERKARHEQWRAEQGIPVRDPVVAERMAMAQETVREFVQMKAWLKAYGGVLTGANR